MELQAYRALYQCIISNQNLIKSIAQFAKLNYLQYASRSSREKKTRCIICNRTYEQLFMLVVHLELAHPKQIEVEKYQFIGDVMIVHMKDRQKWTRKSVYQANHLENLQNKSSSGDKPSVFLRRTHQQRCTSVLHTIIGKLEKAHCYSNQVYFHSSDIFRPISDESMDYDSEEDVGDIERELEKLKIEDFTDVNSNDKHFFIHWNTFIHEKRKKMSLIYSYDMPKMFTEFSKDAPSLNIPRINIVMHGWTLWSVGQIKSLDLIKALYQYDLSFESKDEISKT